MKEIKYLRLTLHDNDFTSYWYELGNAIRSVIDFGYVDFNAVEYVDLETIKQYVAHIWWSMDCLVRHFGYKDSETIPQFMDIDFFLNIDVSIVDYETACEWDNSESIFIPLFKGGGIFLR